MQTRFQIRRSLSESRPGLHTVSALADQLGTNSIQITRLVERGTLVPDFVTSSAGHFLFRVERTEELKKAFVESQKEGAE